MLTTGGSSSGMCGICESAGSDGVVYPTRAAGLVAPAGNSYHSMEVTVGSLVQPDVPADMPRY